MTTTVHRWDASDYLETTDDMLAYLDEAARTGDPQLLQAALGDIAKVIEALGGQITITPKHQAA